MGVQKYRMWLPYRFWYRRVSGKVQGSAKMVQREGVKFGKTVQGVSSKKMEEKSQLWYRGCKKQF